MIASVARSDSARCRGIDVVFLANTSQPWRSPKSACRNSNCMERTDFNPRSRGGNQVSRYLRGGVGADLGSRELREAHPSGCSPGMTERAWPLLHATETLTGALELAVQEQPTHRGCDPMESPRCAHSDFVWMLLRSLPSWRRRLYHGPPGRMTKESQQELKRQSRPTARAQLAGASSLSHFTQLPPSYP